MDGRLASGTFQEALEAERDNDERLIGIQCYGCDYQLWTHVRLGVDTEIICFRGYCKAVTVIEITSRVSDSSPWDEDGRARPSRQR